MVAGRLVQLMKHRNVALIKIDSTDINYRLQVYAEDNLAVMSVGFMLPTSDAAVIWRGPKKNGLIKQFFTDVEWGELDYLIIDTPPGTLMRRSSIGGQSRSGFLSSFVVSFDLPASLSMNLM